ncbi:hypothetical protein LOTGIDRAFT_63496, partial [Lottia gigantea]
PIEFSPNSEFLAYASPDGVLKVWETTSGILKQEYTPSSHLSATCSCLSWSRYTAAPRPKKKRRSTSATNVSQSDDQRLIAMGTTSGSVLIYNVVTGSLQTQLTGGHTETVHGCSWHPDEPSLFTCSSDHHIVEWDVGKNTVKEKWKADKGIVYSVSVVSQKYLLSASRTIKLWNIDGKKELLKTFTGHATEVLRLLPIPIGTSSNSMNGETSDFYFLSAALNDRTVNAWHSSLDVSAKNSLASFSLSDEPVVINISRKSAKDSQLLLSVVTSSGHLLVFEHTLNGRMKKPLKPKVHAQIAASNQNDGAPEMIPILASVICEDVGNNILLAYGSFLKPTFEKIPYDSSQSEICLVREKDISLNGASRSKEKEMTKIKNPETSDAIMLAPGHMMRRKRKPSVGDMTMEDRLNAISIEKPGKKKEELPKADTLINLLSQGLQSNDKELIERVLHHENQQIITNTVRRLPVQLIVPFIKAISVRIHVRQSGGAQVLLKWLKAVLTTHTSYLMTFQEIVDSLSALYQLMEARVGMFSRLSRLQGKLDLMLSQITCQEQEEEEGIVQAPLLLYHEESSEDDDPMEDLLASHSESESNWDVTDMEDESADE